MQKLILKINDMTCTSCALSIDMDLEELDGIFKSCTSYAKSVTEVEYDDAKIDHIKIIQTIKSTGYTATLNN